MNLGHGVPIADAIIVTPHSPTIVTPLSPIIVISNPLLTHHSNPLLTHHSQWMQKGPDFGTLSRSGPMSKKSPEKGSICLSSPEVY